MTPVSWYPSLLASVWTFFLLRLESECEFVEVRLGNEVFTDLPADLAGPLPHAPDVCGPSAPLCGLFVDPSEGKNLKDEVFFVLLADAHGTDED